jgi:hypothetical protein
MRVSSLATLRANAQILELMAAQLETLANRTEDRDEARLMTTLAARSRLLCRQYAEAAGADDGSESQPMAQRARQR